MNIFNTNFKILAQQLLPTFLRKPLFTALISAIAVPFDFLRNKLNLFRNKNLYNLSITSQVCFLEKALNDKFDSELRRIFITNGAWRASLPIYIIPENQPVPLRLTSENQPLPLYLQHENGFINENFVVNVPTELQPFEQDLKGVVMAFKLAGKTFSINYF